MDSGFYCRKTKVTYGVRRVKDGSDTHTFSNRKWVSTMLNVANLWISEVSLSKLEKLQCMSIFQVNFNLTDRGFKLLTAQQRSCGKVIFSIECLFGEVPTRGMPDTHPHPGKVHPMLLTPSSGHQSGMLSCIWISIFCSWAEMFSEFMFQRICYSSLRTIFNDSQITGRERLIRTRLIRSST